MLGSLIVTPLFQLIYFAAVCDLWHILMLCIYYLLFSSELNERQRAILEEFAKEEINSELSGSAEGSW